MDSNNRPRYTEDELQRTMNDGGTLFRESEQYAERGGETPDYLKAHLVSADEVRENIENVIEFPQAAEA